MDKFDMEENRLGQAVRAQRKKLGLTQGALAKMFHISTDYVSKIEKGGRVPSDRTRIDLEDFVAGKIGKDGVVLSSSEASPYNEADEYKRLESILEQEKKRLSDAEYYRVVGAIFGVIEDMRKEREDTGQEGKVPSVREAKVAGKAKEGKK